MPIRAVSKELQDIAIAELNEDPKRIQDDLKHIREWVDKQPHLQNRVRANDQILVSALRSNKFRFEVVKRRIDLLFTMKAQLPEFFARRDPLTPKIQELLETGVCLPLSKTDGPAGPIVVILRIGGADTSKYDVPDAVQLVTMIIDILGMESDNGPISGGHIIIDCKGGKMQDALRVGIDLLRTGFKLSHDAYGIRPKGIYLLNPLPFVETVFNQLKDVFLKNKLHDRVHFIKTETYEELNKYIPRSILPPEYGGNGESIAELSTLWKNKVESYRDYFLEDGQCCADLSKRPEKMEESNLFGADGSFKKLSID